MKLIHLSDLHLGKRVNGFSLLEEQRDILDKICGIIQEEQPQAVLLAGDIYDRPVPSAEAVSLFDDFLVRLSRLELQVFLISGNHDSPERLAFGGRLFHGLGIHLAPVYDGQVEPVVLQDQYGPVYFYLLPFLHPAQVRRCFPEETIESYTDAVGAAIAAMNVPEDQRTVLLAHHFVTGAQRSESEELSVGGTDNVDASVFEPFDYVALGHLHAPQRVAHRETLRYCGAPLAYAFSERGEKSVVVVEMEEKGKVHVRTVPLTPLRRMFEVKGTYDTITSKEYYEKRGCKEDYIHAVLTDEEDVFDAVQRLRTVYPRLMKVSYDNKRTQAIGELEEIQDVEQKHPLDLLEEFYAVQNGQPMGEEARDFAQTLIEKIWEGEP